MLPQNGWARLTHVLICSLSTQAATEVKEPLLALTHKTNDAQGLVEKHRVLSLEKVEADRKDRLVEVEAEEIAARRQRGRKQLMPLGIRLRCIRILLLNGL